LILARASPRQRRNNPVFWRDLEKNTFPAQASPGMSRRGFALLPVMLTFLRPLLLLPLATVATLAAAPQSGSGGASPAAVQPPLPGPVLYAADDCLSCHREQQSKDLNHPLGVLGGKASSPIDCLTCHEAASTRPQHTQRTRGSHDPLLKANPQQLCLSCHKQEGLSNASSLSHGLAMGRAHLATSSKAPARGLGLDRESRDCLSCHDGSTASAAGVREHGSAAWAGLEQASRIRNMHPVGVRYDASSKGSMAPQYRPKRSLPISIRLFDDKVGCGSCHSLYSREEQMLAANPQRGKLCLSCHIK